MRLTLEQLLDVVRTRTEDRLPPDQRAQFDRFVRRAGFRKVAPPEPGLPVAAPAVPRNKRWAVWVAIAASVVAVVGATVVAVLREREANQLAARLADVEAERDKLRDGRPPAPDHPLRLTAEKGNVPQGWKDTLFVHHSFKLTPEENLANLEAVSGPVKAAAATMREKNPNVTARQILDELFDKWGKPDE